MSAVLITNVQLIAPTGSEIVVRDVALGLVRRGHAVAVYTPLLGPPARQLAELGVPVVSDLDDVPFAPDVIHGHHHTPTVDALERFPEVPAIWVCHDRLQYEDIPPRHPSIRRYVAVDLSCRERLVEESGIASDIVSVVHNAVDLERFPQRAPLTGPPRRALVFSNQARPGGYSDVLRAACAARGITLDIVGTGAGTGIEDPERLLGEYDVVFAKARCALEALVSGTAVILADQRGFGCLVTSDVVDELRDWNFGMRTLQRPFDEWTVGQEIDAIDPADVQQVSTHIRKVASLDEALDSYESLYREVVQAGVATRNPHLSPLGSSLDYAALLERRLRSVGVAFSSVALPPGAAAQVRLELRSRLPAVVPPDSAFGVDVSIVNESRELLTPEPSKPVNVCYHWRHPTDPARDIFEGERTPLNGAIHPGASAIVRARVVAPSDPALWRLQITLVQESVMWFNDAHPAHAIEQTVAVRGGEQPHILLSDLVAHLTGGGPEASLVRDHLVRDRLVRDCAVATLSFLDDVAPGALTFVANVQLARQLAGNGHVAAVITSAGVAASIPDHLGLVVTDDPLWTFYALHNTIASTTTFYGDAPPSIVHPTATIDPSARLDPTGIDIGPGCVIGPGVVVQGRVSIGPRTRIDAGAVIGASAFQRSGHAHGDLDMIHVGAVEIGADCHIYANAVIARGQLPPSTVIGDRTHIGNGAFVSHRCRTGSAVTIGHNATVNGRVTVGDGVWIGPGAVIANHVTLGAGCSVALGATVIRDVEPGDEVSGLPALRKYQMFRHSASIKRSR